MNISEEEKLSTNYKTLKDNYEIEKEKNKHLNEENELLKEHNEILFVFVKNFINEFQKIPLFEDGTHRLIVSGKMIEETKQAFINKGYKF